MLIGIDASRTVTDQPTGTEIYSQQLIRALVELGEVHRFRLYFRRAPSDGSYAGTEQRVIPFPRLWTHLRLSWEMTRHPPDVLFVPAHVLPLAHPHASLVTVHDLGYLHFPQAHPRVQRLYLDLSTRWNARAAAHLLADSEATKVDLVTHYGTPKERITVAYPGRDESLIPVSDQRAIGAAKARYGIGGDYILYLGTLQPRKNLARLISAFSTLEIDATLVLAGKRGWMWQDLAIQVQHLGLGDRVLFPGYVAAGDKAALLSGALSFAFPSLYEGFGLPVLEAQACGCPVVTSTTSSLPEVAGGAALLIDPHDVSAIAAALRQLATDPPLRRELIARGLANVRRFSWQVCARTALGAVQMCAESTHVV